MSSSTTVNYLIRPNKNVERKLIFQLLEHLGRKFDFSNYQYIGLGGFVFSDFILAHNRLNITTLFSMEKEGFSRRANFNKPYNCISVIGEESTQGLKKINLDLESIVWLDYDSGIQGPVMEDCIYLSEKLPANSCVFVTLNAHPANLFDEPKNTDSAIKNLKHHAGENVVPVDLKPKDFSNVNYPSLLAKIVLTQISSSVTASARGLMFQPLIFFSYADNAPMITVGGILLDAEDNDSFDLDYLKEKLFYVTEDKKFSIDIPSLTAKEKIHLDSMIPKNELTQRKVSKALKFEMPENHIKSYKQFYKEYPVFGEITN